MSAQLDFDDSVFSRYKVGLEWEVNQKLKFRFGLKQSNEKNNFYYCGLGFPISITAKYLLLVNYAVDPGMMHEGVSHLFSFIGKSFFLQLSNTTC